MFVSCYLTDPVLTPPPPQNYCIFWHNKRRKMENVFLIHVNWLQTKLTFKLILQKFDVCDALQLFKKLIKKKETLTERPNNFQLCNRKQTYIFIWPKPITYGKFINFLVLFQVQISVVQMNL